MKIAINGAGIAGPALAYWLLRHGHEPVLIERAPALRTGGYVIDFWGAGYDIAEKMGILPRLLDLGYQVGEVRFVDAGGRKAGGFALAQPSGQGREARQIRSRTAAHRGSSGGGMIRMKSGPRSSNSWSRA